VADVFSLIGNTPLIELKACSPKPGIRLFAKLEGSNPTGSVKDRIVAYMLRRALAEGRLHPGQEIVEASTGNTGIALAMIGRALGHPVRIVMPHTVFSDVTRALQAFEPQIELVPAAMGIKSAVNEAKQIADREGAYLLNQFGSDYNPRCHYETTAVEIIRQLPELEVFVCGLGTGGTASGVGKRLKEHNPQIKLVGAEPHPGAHVQGIHSLEDGFVPANLDLSLLDGRILVRSAPAFRAVRELLRREGLLAGLSSGAVLHAALKWAQRVERGNIVMLFADAGWKYLNSPAFVLDASLADEEESLDDVLWW
jgi:cysteine synthase B